LDNDENVEISEDQLALTEWLKGVIHDIVKEHSNRLHIPVEVQYMYAPLTIHSIPFQLVDDGAESGRAIVKITLPKEKDSILPVVFPHIVHHELCHIYNPNYEDLWNNRLSPSEISELNTIDTNNVF